MNRMPELRSVLALAIILLVTLWAAPAYPWHGSGNITALAIAPRTDPVTPTTLYAGTTSGVYKSTDGGATWSTASSGLTDLALPNPDVGALALDLLVWWYPTDGKSYRSSVSPAYYKRRLYGVTLDPSRWNPLSWLIHAERARSGLVIDATGSSFPLLIFSPALSASVLDGITQELVIRLREKSSLTSKALQITNSTKAIIHWQSFLIGTCEITRFLQQSASSAVLSSA